MKIEKSLSGFDSGRLWQVSLLEHGLDFIHSNSMLVMVHLLLVGWHQIGTSGKFLNSFKMVVDGIWKAIATAMITNIWTYNMVLSVQSLVPPTHSTCAQSLSCFKTLTLVMWARWFTTVTKILSLFTALMVSGTSMSMYMKCIILNKWCPPLSLLYRTWQCNAKMAFWPCMTCLAVNISSSMVKTSIGT